MGDPHHDPHDDPRDEVLDVVDDDDRVVGQARREEVYAGRLRHRTVMVVVRNSAGEFLVHRRTDSKLVAAGQHDMMVGGVVDAGENYDDAARRELAEEVGVAGVAPSFITSVRFDGTVDAPWPQWIRLYEVTWDGRIVPQESEITWWAWWPVALLETRLSDPAWTWCADSETVWRHYIGPVPRRS